MNSGSTPGVWLGLLGEFTQLCLFHVQYYPNVMCMTLVKQYAINIVYNKSSSICSQMINSKMKFITRPCLALQKVVASKTVP